VDGVFLYRKPPAKHLLSFGDIMSRRSAKSSDRERPARVRPARQPLQEPAERPAPLRREAAAPAAVALPQEHQVDAEHSAMAADLIERAHAMLEQAQAQGALALAREAIELDPANTDAHLVAAFAHADLGQLDEAMAQAQLVLASYPLTAGARYILGIINQQRGNMDAALTEYKRTVYIDRNFVLAHFAIANIYRSRGETSAACREYENTLRALYDTPEGQWTAFLGGFRPDLLAKTCERSLIECGRIT